jgi:hypothetical protein
MATEKVAPAVAEEVLFRTRSVPFLLIAVAPYAVLLVLTLVVLPSERPRSAVILLLVVLVSGGLRIGLRVFELRRLRRPWTLRIAADGITGWPSPGPVRWAELAEIRIRGGRTMWWWLVAGGVTLITQAEIDFSRRAGTKPRGTVLDTRYLDGRPDEVVAAIRRFADLPVIRT